MQFQFVWLAARLKLLNSFAFLGLNHPFRSRRTVVHTFVRIHNIVVSCFWLQSFALRARKSIWHFMRNVCEGTKRKRVANCMKNSTSSTHTHTHTNIHMNCFKMKLTFLMRHLARSRLLYDCSFNDHDSWNGKPGTS